MARSSLSSTVVRPAADDLAVFDGGVARFERGGGDGEAADAGAGHAAGSGVAGDVAPGAVFVLCAGANSLRECPGFAADFDADALAIVEGENGELGIAVVAAGARVGPGAFALAIFDLVGFEPLHIPADDGACLLGRGGTEHHGLQARR